VEERLHLFGQVHDRRRGQLPDQRGLLRREGCLRRQQLCRTRCEVRVVLPQQPLVFPVQPGKGRD
jgi:hypothetical protein